MVAEQQANPVGAEEPGQMSFMERKQMQLRTERDARQPETVNDSSQSVDVETTRRQPDSDVDDTESALVDQPETDDTDEAQDELEAIEEDSDQETDADNNDEAESEEDSDELPEVAKMRAQAEAAEQRAEAAEAKAQSLERDYRRKTAKNGERTRELDQRADVLKTALNAVLHKEQSELAQYQQLDWGEVATDPQRHQQLLQGYHATRKRAEQAQQQLQQAVQYAQEQKQRDLNYQSEVGREILTTEVPGWGPDTYSQARQVAVDKYGMTEAEVDQIVDYRSMLILLDAMKYHDLQSSTAKVVKKVGKKRGKRAPTRRTGTPQQRNHKGQYQAARAEAVKKPGDKNSFLAMKGNQLRMERDRRR